MNKLRGTGSTFSTSGKHWQPFRSNRKVASRNARLHRTLKAGTIKPMTKQQLREAGEQAVHEQGQQ
jgi:hypothetical protein